MYRASKRNIVKKALYWKRRIKSSLNQVKKMEAGQLDSITVNEFLNEL